MQALKSYDLYHLLHFHPLINCIFDFPILKHGLMRKNRLIRLLKKFHKWPSVAIAFFAFLFAISGIIMNHRSTFSSVDVSRKWLPENYCYKNWNLAAVRGSEYIKSDSLIIYGNIGIWKTSDDFQTFTDFNAGFPNGIDNRKIYSVKKLNKKLYAGTHMGLYKNEYENQFWEKIHLPVREERIADLGLKGDTLLVLTRHFLLKTVDGENFETIQLPEPTGYIRETGLFDTFWQLHSGEMFGLPGKLIVDLLGVVTVLLSITGLLHFFFPKIIKKRKRKAKEVSSLVAIKRKNLRWHNEVGYVFVLFLLINTFFGMHLRPPLLIAIGTKKMGIIPGTHLDSPNPWFDKLRRVEWDEELEKYLFSTSVGFFFADESLKNTLQPAYSQPNVSIMGCNVLEPLGKGNYLVGSFSGMFVWNIQWGSVLDFFTGEPYVEPEGIQSPISANMVAGLVEGKNVAFWFDYNSGVQRIAYAGWRMPSINFPEMPEEIRKASPLSLWNAALEIHTGRIFENILGPFYILYVPLAGICLLLVLISGFLLWWKVFRGKN